MFDITHARTHIHTHTNIYILAYYEIKTLIS
jgi:hypothetical protein